MLTAVALLRVSTADQQLGLGAQRREIEAYARAHDFEVIGWHVEIISGGTAFERRPVLAAALEAVATQGAAALIVAKQDRLARDPLVSLLVERALEKLGAALLAVDGHNGTDPAAELMRHVLRAVALFERRLIGLRTRAALAALKASGKVLGRRPGQVDVRPRKRRSDAGMKRGSQKRRLAA
jgi:DNA invertase Pin-like site-specific DNA recombinase